MILVSLVDMVDVEGRSSVGGIGRGVKVYLLSERFGEVVCVVLVVRWWVSWMVRCRERE